MARVKKVVEVAQNVVNKRTRKSAIFSVMTTVNGGAPDVKLVRATTKKAARAVVAGHITVAMATPEELMQAGANGLTILEG